jgi:hypothetical protein
MLNRITLEILKNTWGGDSESKRAFIFKDYRILTGTSLLVLEVLCWYKVNLKQHKSIQGHNIESKFNSHVQFCNAILSQRSIVNIMAILFYIV